MNLSISNIAWPFEEEKAFLKVIKRLGCSGVEIAPSRIWREPLASAVGERRRYKALVEDSGLEISAMQALLYSRRDLGLFLGDKKEAETIEYLKGLCRLARDLGAHVLVFGSPANRKRGAISIDEALERSASFFAKVASAAERLGVCLCIEPLRPEETDFITSAAEGIKLVEMVGSAGFGLHLDAKALAAECRDVGELFKSAKDKLRHFHINDPDLVEVNSTGAVDHSKMGDAIRQSGYDRYVSIEMRMQPDYYESVRRSISIAKKSYIGN